MIERIKSAIVLVAVTVMIWLVADQYVEQSRSFTIQVQVVSSQPEIYASLADPPHQASITFTARGRRIRLLEFSQLVESTVLFEAPVRPSVDAAAAPQSIPTEDLINRIREVRSSKLFIDEVRPRSLEVIVDEYTTIPNVKIEPDYGQLQVTFTSGIDPVSIRLPQFAARQLGPSPVLRPKVERRIREARRPDNTFQIVVPLAIETIASIPGLDYRRARITPSAEITLTGRIETLTETRRMGPVQVTWSVPDDVQREFAIIPEEDANFRVDIEVAGTRDGLAQLDVRQIRGFVEVMAADKVEPGKPIRREAIFVFPPGTDCRLSDDSPKYEFTFRLVPRAPADSGAGSASSAPT